jgi:hypothetical protein
MFNRFKRMVSHNKQDIKTAGCTGLVIGSVGGFFYNAVSTIELWQCRKKLYEQANAFAYNCTSIGEPCPADYSNTFQLNCTDKINLVHLEKTAYNVDHLTSQDRWQFLGYTFASGLVTSVITMGIGIYIISKRPSAEPPRPTRPLKSYSMWQQEMKAEIDLTPLLNEESSPSVSL